MWIDVVLILVTTLACVDCKIDIIEGESCDFVRESVLRELFEVSLARKINS
jgi:hypothetical protein